MSVIKQIVALLGWEVAPLGRGTGVDKRTIGTAELPTFAGRWEAIQLIIAEFGQETILGFLDGNGARVVAQAIARKAIEAKEVTSGDAWRESLLTQLLSGKRTRAPRVSADQVAQQAADAAFDEAIALGVDEATAVKIAEAAAKRAATTK